MPLDLFGEGSQPIAGEAFTGPTPGFGEILGKAAMRGGIRAAKTAITMVAPLVPWAGDENENQADVLARPHVLPRKEDFFHFYDTKLGEAEKFWSLDPAVMTTSQKIVSALGEMPLQLAGGPAMIVGGGASAGMDLAAKGVDPLTATLTGEANLAAGGLAVGLPAGGKTIKQTLALIAANPVMGGLQDYGTAHLLQLRGYEDEAKAFDPLDPAARSVDLLLGAVFGGVHAYGLWKAKKAPASVQDAIDTVELTKQRQGLNPLAEGREREHAQAMEKGLEALAEGRPVDVSGLVGPPVPERFTVTGETFRAQAKEAFNLTEEMADATMALLAARAKSAGETVDRYIGRRFAGIEKGAPGEGGALFQDAEGTEVAVHQQEPAARPPITDTPEFRAWFGDSKVADEQGQPLVVYHGTSGDFSEFKRGQARRRDNGWFGDGFYFSGSSHLAGSYPMYSLKEFGQHGANVMPVYIKAENPYRIDLSGMSYEEGRNFVKDHSGSMEGFHKFLADNGYDSVIGFRDKEIAGDGAEFWEIVVFSPEQIKSAIGNRGTFDPASPNILFQEDGTAAKGAVQFLQDGKALVHAMEGADFSTVVHELGHVFRRDLTRAEQGILDTWMFSQVPGAKWEARHEEAFARAFERYLAEGKAPVPEVAELFDKFKTWMLEVYQRIAGTSIDVKLAPEVRRLFDNLLFREQLRPPSPEIVKLRASLAAEAKEMEADLAEMVGGLPQEDTAPIVGGAAEIRTPEQLQELTYSQPDAIKNFLSHPENVAAILADALEGDARAIETADHGKVTVDGYEKSATWSTAPEWYKGMNRRLEEAGGNRLAKQTVANALRKAAAGKFRTLSEIQQDAVLESIHTFAGEMERHRREIFAGDLQVGDRYAEPDLGYRTVVAERDGLLVLDNGRMVPMDSNLHIMGEVDTAGRVTDTSGRDPLDHAVETILRERGDFPVHVQEADGAVVQRSARELIDEAKNETARAGAQDYLYKAAAVCLHLGE